MKKQKKGFTLAELLIVVAIIAVLVAISIPIFSSQLKKARRAVDQANVRSAKAAVAADYMTEGETGSVTYLYNDGKALKVSSDNLSQISSILSKNGYGESEASANTKDESGASGTPKNNYVFVTIDNTQISARWNDSGIIYDRNANGTGGKLTLTGSIVNNSNILDEIRQLNLKPEDITEIATAPNSVLDNQTQRAFTGLPKLEKIDLSNSTLYSSHINLFQDLPESVTEIDLPECDKPYNIRGYWYYADGYHIESTSGSADDKRNDSRITVADVSTHGNKIYKNNPKQS